MKKTLLTLAAVAMTTMASALPKVVWQCDFETDPEGYIQMGDGEFVTSNNAYFGRYYQNMPNGNASTVKTNYLIIPTTGFSDLKTAIASSDEKCISFSMWVNTTLANKNGIGNYWGPVMVAYNESSSTTPGWPGCCPCLWSAGVGGNIHANATGWYDSNNDATRDAVETWLKQKKVTDATGDTLRDATFDENWTHIAFVYKNIDQTTFTFVMYVDGVEVANYEQAFSDNNNIYDSGSMTQVDRLVIGGKAFLWDDPDNQYAYDDIKFYAGALDASACQTIINLKYGKIDDEEKVKIAEDEYTQVFNEIKNSTLLADLAAAGLTSYSDAVSNKLSEIDGNLSDDPTVDEFNAAKEVLQNLQKEAQSVLDNYNAYISVAEYYTNIPGKFVYPGKDAYVSAIETAKVNEASVKDLETAIAAIDAAEKSMRAALVTYVYTQEGSSIDASVLIENNAFTSNLNDCFDEKSTPTKASWENIGTTGNYDAASYSSVIASLPSQTVTSVFVYSEECYTSKETIGYQQTLKDLKPGYYKAGGKIGTHCAITTQRVFAKTADDEVYKNLAATSAWYELKTPYIKVGEDGTLTLGCKTEGNGNIWDGSVYMSNFNLTYYGENPDFAGDAKEALTTYENAISAANIWAGDKTAENAKLAELKTLAETDPAAALAKADAAVTAVQSIEAKEKSFKEGTYANLQGAVTNHTTETSTDVEKLQGTCYSQVVTHMDNIMAADTTTVAAIATMNELNTAVRDFATMVGRVCDFDETLKKQCLSTGYTLTGASAEKINSLIPILKAAMIASIPQVKTAATLDAPMEVTGIIDNNTFTSNSIANWDYSVAPNSYIYEEVEYYNFNEFSFTQTIKDLPAGTYKLTANAFYRDGGDIAQAIARFYAGTYQPKPLLVGLMSDGNGYADNIRSVGSDSLIVNEGDPTTYLSDINVETSIADNYYCAKSEYPQVYYSSGMASSYNEFTRRNAYLNELYVVVPEKGDVTIGVKKDGKYDGDWCIFDNFRLYYCGQEVPAANLLHPYKTTKKGDVNGDGNVDINDVNAVINVICGGAEFKDQADVNGDGSVDINDVNTVIGVICGE